MLVPVGKLLTKQAAWPWHMADEWARFDGDDLDGSVVRGLSPSITRASPGYRTKSDGTIEDVGSGNARTNHYAAGATKGGLLVEEARTGSGLWVRDLTNAAWVKSASMAAAKDAVGVVSGDGANTASTLTASAATQTCLQTVTKASASHAFGPYIKRKTGTGAVEITVNGGTNWQDVTSSLSTTSWYRAEEVRTATNPQFGFRIGTSGDAIEVDFAGMETGERITSPIFVEGAAQTRAVDDITAAFTATTGTIYCEFRTIADFSSGFPIVWQIDDGSDTNRNLLFMDASADTLIAQVRNGGSNTFNNGTFSSYTGARTKVAVAIQANDSQAAKDGSANTTDSSVTLPGSVTTLRFGTRSSAQSPLNGVIYEWARVPSRFPTANLEAWTPL